MALSPERAARRPTFDEIAELYDAGAARLPGGAVRRSSSTSPASRPARGVVEIGCGTGQATRALAERGLDVTCVELGRRRLAASPRPDSRRFRSPCRPRGVRALGARRGRLRRASSRSRRSTGSIRVACAIELAPGCSGRAATWRSTSTHPVMPAGRRHVLPRVQEDYRRRRARSGTNRAPPGPRTMADMRAEIEASGCSRRKSFGARPLGARTSRRTSIIDALDTYSANRLLPEPERAIKAVRADPPPDRGRGPAARSGTRTCNSCTSRSAASGARPPRVSVLRYGAWRHGGTGEAERGGRSTRASAPERPADPEVRRANLRRIAGLFRPYRLRLGVVLGADLPLGAARHRLAVPAARRPRHGDPGAGRRAADRARRRDDRDLDRRPARSASSRRTCRTSSASG